MKKKLDLLTDSEVKNLLRIEFGKIVNISAININLSNIVMDIAKIVIFDANIVMNVANINNASAKIINVSRRSPLRIFLSKKDSTWPQH